MKIRRETLILFAIFVAVFISRLAVAFSSSSFTYDAYFNIRQVEIIRERGVFTFNDPLAYSPHPFMPLFHYLLAFFSLVLPIGLVLKIVPNLLASLVVFFAYLLAFEMTKDKAASLFSAMSAGFVPIFFFKTVNSLSEYSLVIPLMLLLVYFFIRLNEANFLLYFLFALFALVLSHPTAILFVAGLSMYVFLLYVLGTKASKSEMEIIFFSLISSVWIIFLFFKKPLLVHGFSVLWQNLPSQIISVQFGNLDILDAIYKVGFLTFIAGIFISYKYVFQEKRKDIHVLISLSFMVLVLLAAHLIKLDTGLMFLGIFFAVMSGLAYKILFEYLEKTHISKRIFIIALVLIGIFISTSVFTSLSYRSINLKNEPSNREIDAFSWLSGVTPEQVVFSDIKEGFLVTAVSRQKNFVDNRFILSDDAEQRLSDLETLYTTQSQIAAIQLLDTYNISYLVFTRDALESRNLTGIRYYTSDCFDPVFENYDAVIYNSLCRVSG